MNDHEPLKVQSAALLRIQTNECIAACKEACLAENKAFLAFYEAGKKLLKIKESGQVEKNKWEAFIRERIGIDPRRAQRWMKLAKSDPSDDLESKWRTICGKDEEPQPEEQQEVPVQDELPLQEDDNSDNLSGSATGVALDNQSEETVSVTQQDLTAKLACNFHEKAGGFHPDCEKCRVMNEVVANPWTWKNLEAAYDAHMNQILLMADEYGKVQSSEAAAAREALIDVHDRCARLFKQWKKYQ